MVLARDTVPRALYRPTRSRSETGRTVLRRPTPGQEAAALRRMERRQVKLNGQETMVAQAVAAGAILFRADWRFDGTTRSRWIALSPTYRLREVLR